MRMSLKHVHLSPLHVLSLLLVIGLAIVFLWSPFGAFHKAHADISYGSPFTITDSNYGSGTFSGNWQSTDPNTPVIMIQTSKPVTITNSHLRGPGNLIDTTNSASHNVTITNTYGYGTNPNVAGVAKGFFLHMGLAAKVVVQNCDIENPGFGIFVNQYLGSASGDQTIKILNNRFHNIDARFSDGNGGYQQKDSLAAHAIQLDDIHGVPGMEIAWNEFIDEPYNSDVSDVVNIYRSSGTSSSPLLIHDNYVQGAYAIDPANMTFSGGGILLGDGSASTLAEAVGYIKAYNNQAVATSNYGISLASGHDVEAYNNRVVASGLLPNGSFIKAQDNPGYATSAVGMYLADFYGDIARGTFSNNRFHDNLSGWVEKDANGNVGRHDYYLPDCASGQCTNDASWPGTITPSTEAGELTIWQNKVASSNEQIGPPTTQNFSTGFESGQPQPTWTNTVDSGSYPAGGINNVGGICCGLSGPEAGTRNEITHSGSTALMYSGYDNSSSSSYAYMSVFDLSSQNLVVGSSTTLTYWIYPESSSNSLAGNYVSGSNSTCVAIDLIFSDGSNLRDSGAVDQHGNRAHPAYQCGHLTLDQWNQVTVNLGNNNNGKTIVRLDVGYDQPANTGGYRGYIDDISMSS